MSKRLTICLVILYLIAAPLRVTGSAEEQAPIEPQLVILKFDPEQMRMTEDTFKELSVSITVNHSALWENEDPDLVPWLVYPGRVTVQSDDLFRMDVINGTFNVTPGDFLTDNINETVTLQAYNLGYVYLQIFWEPTSSEPMTISTDKEPATTKPTETTTTTITSTSTIITTTPEPEPDPEPINDNPDPVWTNVNPDPGPVHNNPDPEPVEDNNDPEPIDDNLDLVPVDDNTELIPVDNNADPVVNELLIPEPLVPAASPDVAQPRKAPPTAIMKTSTTATTTKKSRAKKKEEKVNVYQAGATFMFQHNHKLTEDQPTATATKIYFTNGDQNEYKITILRHAGTTDMLFVILISIFVGINTLMMGCQINLHDVWAVLKKPVGPAVGFVSQFLFMPLASYGLAHLLLTGNNIQLGLFTLGCSPGGSGSNFWTLMLKGDLNLSMTMTFISTTCAIFMMPLWLYTLGQSILKRGQITIPFVNLIMSLIMFTVPVGIGLLIKRYKPSWAAFIEKLIRPFTFVLLIALNVLAIWNSMYIFRLMTWQMLVAGMCIAWGGYLFGATMAFLFRQKRPQIIAIAIETAIQNPGVTFMVLRLTLKQPDADMSSVAPVAQLFVTSLPLLILYLIILTYRKCKACVERRKEQQQQQQHEDNVDAIDPLLVKRMDSSTQTANSHQENSKDAANSLGPVLCAKEKEQLLDQRPYRYGIPPFPNMYSEMDDKDLAKRYIKPALTNQPSLGDDPRRTSEPRYVNFQNGKMFPVLDPVLDEESPV